MHLYKSQCSSHGEQKISDVICHSILLGLNPRLVIGQGPWIESAYIIQGTGQDLKVYSACMVETSNENPDNEIE